MKEHTPTLTLRVQPPDKKNGYQVFELLGDLDQDGLVKIKDRLLKIADEFAYQYFIFDLAGLDFINSEGIGFLMTLHSHFVNKKKNLVVTAARAHVKDVLEVIGILSVLEYHDTLELFLQQISQ